MEKMNREPNYYNRELSKVITTGDYSPSIQIRDGEGNCTKWLGLNRESIEELIVWLELLRENDKYK